MTRRKPHLYVLMEYMHIGECLSGYVMHLPLFQRCMMSIFSDFVEDIMEVFMDDFSVYGSSFDACLDNLSKVLQRCE